MATEMIEGCAISVVVNDGKKSWFCPHCNKFHKSKITLIRHIPLYKSYEEVKEWRKNYLDDCEKEYKQHKELHMAENWDKSKNDEWQEEHWKLAKKVRDARDSYAQTMN